MIYDETQIDLDSITWNPETETTCLLCASSRFSGYLPNPTGVLRLCPACVGTGVRKAKSHRLQSEVFQIPKGRESLIG